MQELVDDRLKRPLRLNDRERSDDSFSFAMASSPETAFGSVAMQELLDDRMKHPLRFNDREGSDDFYAFAMASSPETAFGGVAMQELLDDRMKHQLQQVLESQRAAQTKKQEEEEAIQAVLPKTLAEAMIEEDRRAIVVTTATAPFEIIHVNNAWVGLCGFSKGEALHNTLNLLQGPQTNRRHAQHLLHELQHGHAASAVITNYTKQGRPFKNLVRVAPIRDDSRRISYFVGVLEEIVNQAQRDDHDGRHMMRAA
jgi:PAS domain S-box-containing protein